MPPSGRPALATAWAWKVLNTEPRRGWRILTITVTSGSNYAIPVRKLLENFQVQNSAHRLQVHPSCSISIHSISAGGSMISALVVPRRSRSHRSVCRTQRRARIYSNGLLHTRCAPPPQCRMCEHHRVYQRTSTCNSGRRPLGVQAAPAADRGGCDPPADSGFAMQVEYSTSCSSPAPVATPGNLA